MRAKAGGQEEEQEQRHGRPGLAIGMLPGGLVFRV